MSLSAQVQQARDYALEKIGDKKDVTNRPHMIMLDAVAAMMPDDDLACIAYEQVMANGPATKFMELMTRCGVMRVACAVQRFSRFEDENEDDYLRRVAKDDLLYPVVLADAKYLKNPANYDTDTETMLENTSKYSDIYHKLKKLLALNGKKIKWKE